MNIKKIAAVAGATMVGLSAAGPNRVMASSETPGVVAESAPIDARNIADAERWQTLFEDGPLTWRWPDAAVGATLTVSNVTLRKVTRYVVPRVNSAAEGSFSVPELNLSGDGERLFDVSVAFSDGAMSVGETLSARLAIVSLSDQLDVPLVTSRQFCNLKNSSRLAFCDAAESFVMTPVGLAPLMVEHPVRAGYNAVNPERFIALRDCFTLSVDNELVSPVLRYIGEGLMFFVR